MTRLVRDKVPDLQRTEGLAPVVTVDLDAGRLFAKVREELAELEAAEGHAATLEEYVDLCEAVRALRGRLGLGAFEVAQAQHAKREAKGGFEAGAVLDDGVPAPRRMVHYDTAARDVARFRALLAARGIEASDADIALAYEAHSEMTYGVGWLDHDRPDEAGMVDGIIAHLEEVR